MATSCADTVTVYFALWLLVENSQYHIARSRLPLPIYVVLVQLKQDVLATKEPSSGAKDTNKSCKLKLVQEKSEGIKEAQPVP